MLFDSFFGGCFCCRCSNGCGCVLMFGGCFLDYVAPSTVEGIGGFFFEPMNLFIQRWLHLFYVPSMVIFPLAVRDMLGFPLHEGWPAKWCFCMDFSAKCPYIVSPRVNEK